MPNVNATKNRRAPQRGRRNKKQQKQQQRQQKVRVPRAEGKDIMSESQAREDLRINAINTTASQEPFLNTMNSALTQEVATDQDIISAPALAYLSYALTRGYQEFATTVDMPFFAYVYCCQILSNFASNAPPLSPEVPRWLYILGCQLGQKRVNFSSGEAIYKFKFSGTSDCSGRSYSQDIGYIPNGYKWNVGVVSGTQVNFYPTIVAPGTAYTLELGADAWTSVSQFMQNSHRGGPNASAHELVSTLHASRWQKDASAYASVANIPGTGQAGVGGQHVFLQHEVPIRSPFAAKFAPNQTASFFSDRRGYNSSAINAGDGVTYGGAISEFLPSRLINMFRSPKIKYVDFDEFVAVLAQYVSLLQETAASDPTSSVANTLGTLNPTIFQCPLTFQDMMLCLRSVMMSAFAHSQSSVQSVYASLPGGGSDNSFVPFVSGMGTCALSSTTGMLLPLIFVENIRSLTMRVHHVGKGKRKSAELFMPCLGRFQNKTFDPDTYVYPANVPGSDPPTRDDYPSFTSGDAIWTTIDKKTGKVIPLVEAVISTVDGSTGGQFAAINDPRRLGELITLWNRWIINLQPYSVSLTPLGTDGGINALASVGLTRFLQTSEGLSSLPKPKVAEVKTDCVDTRLMTKGRVGDPYTDVRYIATSSHDPVFGAIWEQIQSFWILPIMPPQTNGMPGQGTQFSKMVALNCEPFTIVSSQGSSAVSAYDLHASYAESCVMARNSPPSATIQFLENMARQGRGGNLSSLVGSLLSGIFPQAKGVIDTVAGIVPF